MTTITSVGVDPNPYVGPRAFQLGEPLYGRDVELAQLLDVLIAERIVLLYSPSGAGKTSLLQAGLIIKLRTEGFRVVPTIRVGLETSSGRSAADTNRYIQSVLSCLEEGLPGGQGPQGSEPPAATFRECLDRWRRSDSDNLVLIFDQFEELVTLDPTDRSAKEEFLAEVGDLLQDRRHWAVFAMREDYVAGLDPYLHLIPTRLATNFRLDFLAEEAARAAIQRPALDRGVLFSDAATTKLLNDLRRVLVQRPEGLVREPGPYIVPVHLQVVCRRLWDGLQAGATAVDEADLEAVNVDSALADYYDERVTAIAAETGVSERSIRDWFESKLITEEGFRGQVLTGPKAPGDGGSRVLSGLQDAFLVRGDKRKGAVWYELAHDNLIDPIRTSNADWRERNLSTLERQAHVWEAAEKPDDLLLTEEVLAEAEKWAAEQAAPLGKIEGEFLAACRQLRAEAEQAKKVRQTRRRLFRLLIVGLISVIAAGSFLGARSEARRDARSEARRELARIEEERQKAAAGLFDITQGRVVLDAITNLPEVQALDPRDKGLHLGCSRRLKTRLEQYRRFHDFGVADERGEVRCIALFEDYERERKENPKETNFADRPWFKKAEAERKEYAIGEFQIGRITGCPTVTFARFIPRESRFFVAWGSLYLSWLPDNEPPNPNPHLKKCDGR